MHTCNMQVHLPSFYTHWEFSDSLGFTCSGLSIFYFTDQVFREDHTHNEKLGVLFAWSPNLRYGPWPSFYSCWFTWFSTD